MPLNDVHSYKVVTLQKANSSKAKYRIMSNEGFLVIYSVTQPAEVFWAGSRGILGKYAYI